MLREHALRYCRAGVSENSVTDVACDVRKGRAKARAGQWERDMRSPARQMNMGQTKKQKGVAKMPPPGTSRRDAYFHSVCCSTGSSVNPKAGAIFLPMVPGDATGADPQVPLAVLRMDHSIAPSRGLRLELVLPVTAPV